ncbi:MAG: GNAT family N-acetyltransferase, partial [Pseudomonadota bacterium]
MFETSRLRLRPWRPEDRAGLDAILGDAEVMRFSDTGVLDPAAQAAWLERAT